MMNEEITLRELIEMILKRKWLICIITAAAILLSGIYSFFILKPTYSASATLLANPIENKQTGITAGINEMVDSLAVFPDMTIDTYKEQVINSTVLTNTINELNLTNDSGEAIQWSTLAKKLSVEKVGNTNLLKITVKDKDPEMAAKIANSVADKFIKYVSDNTRKFGEQATAVIEERLKNEESKLEEEAKKLKEYLANSQNIDQLKLEVQSLYSKIDEYNIQLIDIEKQIQADIDALKVILGGKETFSNVNLDDIKLNVPLDNSNSNQDLEISVKSGNELQDALVTIKATEIETRLVQNNAEKSSLEAKIKELEDRLKETQSLLAEEEYKYNAILRNYDLAEQTYNAYLDRHKEAVLAATSNIGESAIIVSAPATVPIVPSNHGKLFYLVIGTFIGLIFGVFVAFVVGYWKETDPRKREQFREN